MFEQIQQAIFTIVRELCLLSHLPHEENKNFRLPRPTAIVSKIALGRTLLILVTFTNLSNNQVAYQNNVNHFW